MPLIKVKPTSPGRRALVKVVTPELHKGEPHWALTEKKSRTSGRNNHGRITVRHKGGGHKQHYRMVDFRRNKDGITATVERLEWRVEGPGAAAEVLGINPSTLRSRMRKLGIRRPGRAS